MCKLLFPVLFTLLIVGCDVHYQLNYVVTNDGKQTICIADTNKYSLLKKDIFLKSGESDTIIMESGLGELARIRYEDNKREGILKKLSFFSDSIKSDSTQFFPAGKWEYSETNRGEGKAILIITADDLKK